MKILKNIFFASIAVASLGTFSACSDEEATLTGADAIYIEMTPDDITLSYRDTVAISAKVTNKSGDEIVTPIKWTVDDPAMVTILGDTAITCVKGARGETKLRATLKNNMYAVAPVTVSQIGARGVQAVVDQKRTYYYDNIDTVWFKVSPASVLEDIDVANDIKFNLTVTEVFTDAAAGQPTEFEIIDAQVFVEMADINAVPAEEGEEEGEDHEGVEPDPEAPEHVADMRPTGRVGIVFLAPRISGKGVATLSLTSGEDQFDAECELLIYPDLVLTFFEDRNILPSLEAKPNENLEVEMDINTETTISAYLAVPGGWNEDVRNAGDFHTWKIEGTNILPVSQSVEYVDFKGAIADLTIRSGATEGESKVIIELPNKFITAYVQVNDFKKVYPVNNIICPEEVSVQSGKELQFEVKTDPEGSFFYNLPVVTSRDESIVTVGERTSDDGYNVKINGHKPGTTYLDVKSGDKTAVIRVVVEDVINYVRWAQGNPTSALEGETAQFALNISMGSGLPYTGTVEWTSSDNAVATVAPNADQTTATVTAIAAGEVTITATVDGNSVSTTFQVVGNQNILLENLEGEMLNDDYYFFVMTEYEGEEVYIIFNGYAGNPSNIAGRYTGPVDGGDIFQLGDVEFELAEFDITITADGDDAILNGTLTTSTGRVIEIKNLHVANYLE